MDSAQRDESNGVTNSMNHPKKIFLPQKLTLDSQCSAPEKFCWHLSNTIKRIPLDAETPEF